MLLFFIENSFQGCCNSFFILIGNKEHKTSNETSDKKNKRFIVWEENVCGLNYKQIL